MRDSVFRHCDILNIEYREITLRLRFHSRIYHLYFACNFRLHQIAYAFQALRSKYKVRVD
jgi:hypothetical protein